MESPLAECNIDYLLKNQKAEVNRMWSSGQKGYCLPASPVTTSPSPEQRESRRFSTSRETSSRKPKLSNQIGTGNDLLYPQGLCTLISDVRISVLVLDSVVDDVAAMIVDYPRQSMTVILLVGSAISTH